MGGYIDQHEIDVILKELKKRVVQADHEKPDNIPSPEEENLSFSEAAKEKTPLVKKVEFAPFKSQYKADVKKPDLEFFDNIGLVISGELGGVEITVRDLLKLEKGSVLKLDKLAGESAAILVNGHFLGQAEVVVINDCFGLRITAIGNGEVGMPEEG